MNARTELSSWKDLQAHARDFGGRHLRQLFHDDPRRFEHLSVTELDFLYDFTRQRLTPNTMGLLLALARECGLEERIAALFAGEQVNNTERRAAMHMALRNRSDRPVEVDGRDVMPDVRQELAKIHDFVTGVHEGRITGAKGGRFTDVVNIGIGGSDLGIVMATEALGRYRNRAIRLHCVSNIDGVELAEVMESVDPSTTLFVICSKTFTTLETLSNANSAREWLVSELGEAAVARHFVAVSTNHKAMDAFGIAPGSRFTMWDWVGGRYSLWSAVGLSIALALGMSMFEYLLAGGHEMDEHFRTAPLERNLPVLMGLIGVWNGNFLGNDSLAVLPYDRRLQQRAALVLPAAAPGHGARGHGLHRAGECLEPLPGPARPGARQLPGAGRSLRARPDRGAGARRPACQRHTRARDRATDAPQGARRQPAVEPDPFPATRPARARAPDRVVRAQGVRAERDLGREPVRPVGRRARQEACGADGAGSAGRRLARWAAPRAVDARDGGALARGVANYAAMRTTLRLLRPNSACQMPSSPVLRTREASLVQFQSVVEKRDEVNRKGELTH
jgi:hypothetical protein